MLFSGFCSKEVVVSTSGARLGTVDDMVFNEHTGQVEGFYIYGRPRWLCGERLAQDLYVSLADVQTGGEDILLVAAYSVADGGERRKKRLF